nr:A24 family peptidase C-terminal domain-containing protein [Thermococcus stetteri]
MGLVTSYTDLKTGFIFDNHVSLSLVLLGKLLGWEEKDIKLDIPSWLEKLPIPAVEVGILYYLYKGLSTGDLLVALSGFLAFFVGLMLGLVLFYMGAWASGDALILAGFSALLPYPPKMATVVAPYYSRLPLYPVAILFNSLLAVFPFIIVYTLAVVVVRKKTGALKEIFVEKSLITVKLSVLLLASLGFKLLVETLTGYRMGPAIGWLFAVVIIVLLGKFEKVGIPVSLAVLGYLIYINPIPTLLAFFRLLVVLYSFKVFLALVKFLRVEVLMEEVPVEELREWDILGETIYELEGQLVRDRTSFWDKIKDALLKGDTGFLKKQEGRIIASPTAEGLTKEQSEELKKLVEEGKLENRFLRKKAMPFAPAIFLGFLISYFWGDIFWWLELKVLGL